MTRTPSKKASTMALRPKSEVVAASPGSSTLQFPATTSSITTAPEPGPRWTALEDRSSTTYNRFGHVAVPDTIGPSATSLATATSATASTVASGAVPLITRQSVFGGAGDVKVPTAPSRAEQEFAFAKYSPATFGSPWDPKTNYTSTQSHPSLMQQPLAVQHGIQQEDSACGMSSADEALRKSVARHIAAMQQNPHIGRPVLKNDDRPLTESVPVVSIKSRALKPEDYTIPFCEFLTKNPTVFHAVDHFAKQLEAHGYKKLSERALWTSTLEKGGKYFVERNGSSLIAFSVGKAYKSGQGIAMVAGHVDALTARLKPVSTKPNAAGYLQLGVAPYAGALNTTWWDRDLSIGGRVLIKDDSTGKISTKLVKLDWPIARIPTLAPHFGVGMLGTNNAETQAVPIIGLDNSDLDACAVPVVDDGSSRSAILGGGAPAKTFASTQPPKLVRAIAGELGVQNYSSIVNWELELYDCQPAQVGGLDKEFIFAGRIDDKLCSFAAMEALLAANSTEESGTINLVGLFDDEEIGSLLRQGARGNFLPSVVERICEAFAENSCGANVLSQTYANSFLISADVTHAVNPNFLGSYLASHAPRLNVGMVISADSNGHMTTDAVSTALLTRCAEKCNASLQVFQIRNDSRSGGTVGPMLSSAMGVRAVDAGIPQLSMHSIRATTGSLDPGLGVLMMKGFFEHFEAVDQEFA